MPPVGQSGKKKQHDIDSFNAIELKLLSFYTKTLTYDKKTFCRTYKELPVTVIYQQKKGLKHKRPGRGIIGSRWFLQQFRAKSRRISLLSPLPVLRIQIVTLSSSIARIVYIPRDEPFSILRNLPILNLCARSRSLNQKKGLRRLSLYSNSSLSQFMGRF